MIYFTRQCQNRYVWCARGGRGRNNSPGAEKPQQCRKYFLQYSTFASERPQVRTWGRQTCFLPRAPPNLVTSLLASDAICTVNFTGSAFRAFLLQTKSD